MEVLFYYFVIYEGNDKDQIGSPGNKNKSALPRQWLKIAYLTCECKEISLHNIKPLYSSLGT